MAFIAAELDRHRLVLARALARCDGVYAVEDWAWSALCPLLNSGAPRIRLEAGAVAAAHVFGLLPQAEIGSVLLTQDRPIAWPALRLWLESLLSLRGADILRLKGLVHLAGEPAPVVLQAVHHVLHPLARLPTWPDGVPRTQLVLITQGLSAHGLRESFAETLAQRGGGLP